MWIPGLSGGPVFDDAARLLTAAPNASVALGVVSIWQQSAEQLGASAAAVTARFAGRLLTGLGVSNPESAATLMPWTQPPSRCQAGSGSIGALDLKMAKIAADRAAGLHPFLVPARASSDYRRHVGAETLLAPHLAVVLETDPDRARAIARARIGMFISFPS